MRALSIAELEAESGITRSTIYYYVRAGLLPPAQKSSPSRAIYSDNHLALLLEIKKLKDEGLGLDAIRARLEHKVRSANENGEDLVARQAEDTRRAILQVAVRHFARKGFRKTRVADIIAELRITPQVLYANFPTKRNLFASCYVVYLEAMMGVIEPRVEDETDPAVHLIWRMYGSYGLAELNPDLFLLAREEESDPKEGTDLRALHEIVLAGPTHDIERMRRGPGEPPFSDELISYALFGAMQTLRMRASWDETFSREDVMWTEIALFQAIRALYEGSLDVAALRSSYGELIEKVAGLPLPVPPEFES